MASKLWKKETNPESGEKFEAWYKMLCSSGNGGCDFERLINSGYGDMLAENNALRFRFEEDPMGEECLEFYSNLGVKKEYFPGKGFYDRKTVFSPYDMQEGRLYPLIFWNHGGANAIETDEFSVRFSQMAGKEKFILVMLQDTRWENVDKTIDEMCASYPVDKERIYVTGYSQGGQAAHSALLRIPGRLAGAAPCGAECFQHWDHMDVRYTVEEIQRLRRTFVPVIQLAGLYEFLQFLPVNRYTPIYMNPQIPGAAPTTYKFPGHDLAADPTNPPGKRADKPFPPEGEDPDAWKLERFNLRMYTQRCQMRDVDKCLSYRNTPEDRLHHALGFYGDREEIRNVGGTEEYIADIDCDLGFTGYRYVGFDNYPHWPMPDLAEICWEFLKNYRRDSKSGKIVFDTYKPE